MPTIEEDLREAASLRKLAVRAGLSASAKGKFLNAAKRLDNRAGKRADRTARSKHHKSNTNLR